MEKDLFADVYKTLEDVKPLTPEEIDRLKAEAHATPEMQALDAEIRQLKAVNRVFERKEGKDNEGN